MLLYTFQYKLGVVVQGYKACRSIKKKHISDPQRRVSDSTHGACIAARPVAKNRKGDLRLTETCERERVCVRLRLENSLDLRVS